MGRNGHRMLIENNIGDGVDFPKPLFCRRLSQDGRRGSLARGKELRLVFGEAFPEAMPGYGVK